MKSTSVYLICNVQVWTSTNNEVHQMTFLCGRSGFRPQVSQSVSKKYLGFNIHLFDEIL